MNALSGGLLCDKLTDLTVDNAMSLIGIIEKEGLVENCHLGNERSEDSVGSGEHVNGAKLSALIHISLVSELAARKDFDLDAAFGCFLNFLSDRESALVEVAAVGVNHAELERDDIGRSCGIGAYGRIEAVGNISVKLCPKGKWVQWSRCCWSRSLRAGRRPWQRKE